MCVLYEIVKQHYCGHGSETAFCTVCSLILLLHLSVTLRRDVEALHYLLLLMVFFLFLGVTLDDTKIKLSHVVGAVLFQYVQNKSLTTEVQCETGEEEVDSARNYNYYYFIITFYKYS